jgi:polyhydroxyalkanoate synthase
VLANREDHIVPSKTAYRTTQLVSGDVRFVLGASGHIAGVINPAARGTHAPGQHRVSRDRDAARPLRHGARRLNQIWRLEEENHD